MKTREMHTYSNQVFYYNLNFNSVKPLNLLSLGFYCQIIMSMASKINTSSGSSSLRLAVVNK